MNQKWHSLEVSTLMCQIFIANNFRNDECVEGGKNVLLDSFSLLEQLRVESPQHFATLARVPATFQNTAYSQRCVNLDRDDNDKYVCIMTFMFLLHRGGKVAPQPDLRYQRPHITLDSSGRVSTLSGCSIYGSPLYKALPNSIMILLLFLYWYKCVA